MPENHENDSNFLGVQAIAITPMEVQTMYSSCKAAVNLAEAGVHAMDEINDDMGVMSYTVLAMGLKQCVGYFEKMMSYIDKLKDARKESEPDLNELNDKDGEN